MEGLVISTFGKMLLAEPSAPPVEMGMRLLPKLGSTDFSTFGE